MMCADFQDPPEILVPLVRKWYEGSKVVMARKRSSDESFFIGFLRKLFYLALRAGNPVLRFGLQIAQVLEFTTDLLLIDCQD